MRIGGPKRFKSVDTHKFYKFQKLTKNNVALMKMKFLNVAVIVFVGVLVVLGAIVFATDLRCKWFNVACRTPHGPTHPGPCPTSPTHASKRLRGNFSNDMKELAERWQHRTAQQKEGDVFKMCNCPPAFPPGEDHCTTYSNSNVCSTMQLGCVELGDDLESINIKDPKFWQTGGGQECDDCGRGYTVFYNDGCYSGGKFSDACKTQGEFCENTPKDDRQIGNKGYIDAIFKYKDTNTIPPEILTRLRSQGSKHPKPEPHIFCQDPAYPPAVDSGGGSTTVQKGMHIVTKGTNTNGEKYATTEQGWTSAESCDRCDVQVMKDAYSVSRFGSDSLPHTTSRTTVSPPSHTTAPLYGPSRCIAGIGDNVCFTPYQHILGSHALQEALKTEVKNQTKAGREIKELLTNSDVFFALGSAGVANNADTSGKIGNTHHNNGRCYQIALPSKAHQEKDQYIIMQSINTGLNNAFDIFQSAGGAGAFPDDGWGYCSATWGTNIYKDAPYLQNMPLCSKDYSSLQDAKKACEDQFGDMRGNIYTDAPKAAESFLESCAQAVYTKIGCSNHADNAYWQAIECPEQLTRVSGLALQSGPPARPPIQPIRKFGKGEKWYSAKDFGPNVVGKNPIGGMRSDAPITQMQDCRSPDSAQCFNLDKDSNPDPNFTSTYNIGSDGHFITDAGTHGCLNLPYIGTFHDNAQGLDPKGVVGTTTS